MKSLAYLALLTLLSNVALANIASKYTSLKVSDCTTMAAHYLLPEEEQEVDFYQVACPALGGYKVGIEGGDLRYSLVLSFLGTNIPQPSLLQFHNVGETAEWRYIAGFAAPVVDEPVYTALIYRLNYADYLPNGDVVDKSKLVVVRLAEEQSCVVGIVEEQADMNDVARAIADDSRVSCLTQF